MGMTDSEIRERLMQDDAEFRKVAAEHQTYDQQLTTLDSKHFLTEEETLELKTLKKKKLALKDQLYAMVQKYRKQLEG
ncbi:MAG: DUF465 domain-containing protein [Acidobacteriota bacterium]|jgi:uncharacterized protein YdcH (DUF465 family)|nr:DUF465 domain-containing protein [Acidobacteriota bacterium]